MGLAVDGPVERLLASEEPSIRLKMRRDVLGEEPDAELVEEVRQSPRVRALISERAHDGTIPHHPYAKWNGAHWVLALLAELGYRSPRGPVAHHPLREQVYAWLLSDYHERRWTRPVAGLPRIHASQEAYAAWALLVLDAADDGVELLIDRLLRTQWPDGGWNCDSSASGRTSAFSESLLPLRALALHARLTGSDASRAAAERAAEVFLSRRLFRRRSTGDVIAQQYVELHWPRYWRYDFLFSLVVMREAGFLDDPRCADALDLLESKRLPDGGYPLEGRWDGSMATPGKRTPVSWGRVDRARMNEWVTADAFAVLHSAGRL